MLSGWQNEDGAHEKNEEFHDKSMGSENSESNSSANDESDNDIHEDFEDIESVRLDVIEKAFKSLSADAQRGDGELSREDVNRTYQRRQLSIMECMEVEGKILSAGYRILDDEELDEATNPGAKHHYLSEQEEKDLGRKIQLAMRLPKERGMLDPSYVYRIIKDAEKAKAAFVASNIRYVEQVARRRGEHQHLTLEDVMQEGLIGLLRATDLFDPERGFRFKTYATWWIDQYMRRAIAKCDRTIRLPVHVLDQIFRLKRAKAKLAFSLGHQPTLDELANALGIKSEKLMMLIWRVETTNCAEGDAPIGDDNTLLSLVTDTSESAFDKIVFKELQQRFRDVLKTLTRKEARIVRMRFGIDLNQVYTLEGIAQDYNVTRERIRQIEATALDRLRHPIRSDLLSDFLDK